MSIRELTIFSRLHSITDDFERTHSPSWCFIRWTQGLCRRIKESGQTTRTDDWRMGRKSLLLEPRRNSCESNKIRKHCQELGGSVRVHFSQLRLGVHRETRSWKQRCSSGRCCESDQVLHVVANDTRKRNYYCG